MPTTTKILSSAALGLVFACLAPTASHASEVVISAAACSQVVIPDAETVDARSGGGFAAAGGAVASLVCPVPTDEIDSSSGGGDDDDGGRVTFRVAFLDSDAAGTGATVTARLFRTTLAAGTPAVVDTPVCGPETPLVASPVTVGPAQARFSCPRLAANAFYHLKVNLGSSTETAAAFAGVVAED